jgi:site-specific recombinase XerD
VADYLPKGCLICLELFAMNVALPQRCTAQGLFPGQVALRLYRRVVESPSHRHPREMAEPDLTRFLTHLAVEGHVSESTRQVAVSAILVLYERVLEQPLNRLAAVVRAKPPKRLPVVLTRAEVVAVPSRMCGVPRLVATLQYSSGPRVLAALQLRFNGLDVATGEVVMRKAVLQPAIDAGPTKCVTTHAFLDSFAAQLPEVGYDIRTVHESLGPSRRQDTHGLYSRAQPQRSKASAVLWRNWAVF